MGHAMIEYIDKAYIQEWGGTVQTVGAVNISD